MELRHLRYFVAVGETPQLRPRGVALHIAQPPLSRADPRARGRAWHDAVPSRHARRDADARRRRALLPEARRLLRDAEAFREGARHQYAAGEAGHARDRLREHGRVQRAAAHRAGVSRASSRASACCCARRRPDAQVPELVAGEIDVGFVIAASVPPPLAYAPLHREPMIAALPARRRWPTRVHVRMLKDEPFILFPREVAPELHDAIVGYAVAPASRRASGRRRSRCRRS